MEHMIIKAIWNGIVGLPLHVHKITLGEYIEQHNDELAQLIHVRYTMHSDRKN
jgi:hypothetical protein